MKGSKDMKPFGRQFGATAALAAALAAGPAWSQGMTNHASGSMDHSKMGEMKPVAAAAEAGADGEVRRVDRTAGKVTLRHGEIKEHEMPPMTMVFEVRDRSLLEAVKPGDKVKFRVIDENGKMIVTEMKPAS